MEKNDKIILEIYRKMYKESEPKGDLNKMMKSGETKKPDWFMKYYMPQERQVEIIEAALNKYNVAGLWLRNRFRAEILLGSAPSSVSKEQIEQKKQKKKKE